MAKMFKCSKQVCILLPMMPNYVKVDGIATDVGDIDQHILRKLSKEWVKEFLKHAFTRAQLFQKERKDR